MKKTYIFIVVLLSFFAFSMNVSAGGSKSGNYFNCDGASSQCISCTYKNATYYAKSDGAGSISVAWETKTDNNYTKEVGKSASAKHFCSTNNCDSLSCPSSIYMYPDTTGTNYYTFDEPSATYKASIPLSNSSDNGKPFLSDQTQNDINNGNKYNPLSCEYYTYMPKQGSSTPSKSSSKNFVVAMDANGNFTITYKGGVVSNASSLANSGNITVEKFSSGKCPEIYVSCRNGNGNTYICSASVEDIYYGDQDASGDKEQNGTQKSENKTSDEGIELVEDGCGGVFGDPENPNYIAYYLQLIFNIMKFLGPVLVIVMSIIDLLKVTAEQKQDGELEKLGTKTLKRLIYAVIIFVLPSLINYLFGLIGLYGTCGIS